jgi:hypothetical protein
MSPSVADPVAIRAWSDREKLWVELADGRILGVPLGFFPRLMHASVAERNALEMSAEGRGLHWDQLDEDILVAGLLAGHMDGTKFAREHTPTCSLCNSSTRRG